MRWGVVPELLLTCDSRPPGEVEGIRVHALPLPPARKGKSLPLYPVTLRRLSRFLRDMRPDIVHLNDLDDTIYFVLACRWGGGIPVVAQARSVIPPRKFRKLRAHRLHRLVCVSTEVCRLAALGGVLPDRTVVLHDPPDPRWKQFPSEEDRARFRERFDIPAGAPVIGTVGNISHIKGTDLLVRALPRVASRFPEVRCVIVGGDDHGLRGSLEVLAGESGVSRNVTFAGPLPDPRVAVSLMDVFVLPSREEGYGLALLEAMMYGRAVVASRVGGVPDIVSGDEVGVLSPPGDAGALGAEIASLLEDPERRLRIGKAAAERVRTGFEESERMGTLRRIYEELVPGIAP